MSSNFHLMQYTFFHLLLIIFFSNHPSMVLRQRQRGKSGATKRGSNSEWGICSVATAAKGRLALRQIGNHALCSAVGNVTPPPLCLNFFVLYKSPPPLS